MYICFLYIQLKPVSGYDPDIMFASHPSLNIRRAVFLLFTTSSFGTATELQNIKIPTAPTCFIEGEAAN
jgi:hypothetical protein